MPIDYSNGKIYKLWSFQTDKIYIGSTCQTLSQRIGKHRATYRSYLNGNGNYVTSFELIKFDDCKIELLENVKCNDKYELLKIEGKYIRKMNCVNKCIAGRMKFEWYQDNRDKICEQRKHYRQDNKERKSAYDKKYYQNNKERKSEQRKQYYLNNKEKLSEQMKQYRQSNKEKVACECGSEVTKLNLKRHTISKKHQNWINHNQ